MQKGGVPLVPKLPPTLYIYTQFTILRCSKAPRGLSVLLRLTRIFTGATFSPSFSLRQFPSRYAFHAGRYLADKEFRYLRTVRVTAAIHPGLDSMLQGYPLTSPVNLRALGRRQPLYFDFRLSRDLCFW
jgi:hypothetical protein